MHRGSNQGVEAPLGHIDQGVPGLRQGNVHPFPAQSDHQVLGLARRVGEGDEAAEPWPPVLQPNTRQGRQAAGGAVERVLRLGLPKGSLQDATIVRWLVGVGDDVAEGAHAEGARRVHQDLAHGPRGQPEEVAALACFLASPAAAAITGTVLPIDAGWTANGAP